MCFDYADIMRKKNNKTSTQSSHPSNDLKNPPPNAKIR